MRIYLLAALGLLFLLPACKKQEELRTASGFRYIIYEDKEGETPQPGDVVYFHAQVRQNDSDSIFYDTRKDDPETPSIAIPAEEAGGQPASPIVELIRLLSPGDSARVIWELDTLTNKPMGFETAKELYYDIVVLEVRKRADIEAEKEKVSSTVNDFATAMRSGAKPEGIQTSASGLQYLILEQGAGPAAEEGKNVSVHYYGALPDGTLFDTSLERGSPLPFVLGDPGLIPGWTEGVDLLNQGGKALLFIPYNLGYGDAGFPPVIPEKSNLIFYIELISVQ